jgi:hypothetical protein
VRCAEYNGIRNVLFLMRHDDWRFRSERYQEVTSGAFETPGVFAGTNGQRYQIYPDWSAKALEHPIPIEESPSCGS